MPSIRERYYLRRVDRRWRNELRKARHRVLVLSPYITSPLAEMVLECASPGICEIYTTLSVATFAAGASSINTLQELQKRKYPIYELGGLHAKIFVVDEAFASIGSQNLTQGGVSNLEATVAISDRREVAAIVERLQPWLVNRRPITRQLLADVREKILEVAKRFEAARREATRLETHVREALRRRGRELWAERARESLHGLLPDGKVSDRTAREFIRRSLIWEHPTGAFVSPKKFASRVFGSDGDWRLRFGANTFLVGRAIQRCAGTIESFLSDVVSGNSSTNEDLFDRLRLKVRGAVANYKGNEFNYPLKYEDYMMFGVHGINIEEFISPFKDLLPSEDIPT